MVRIASWEHLRRPLFLTEGGSESEHSIQENSVSWRYQYGVVMGPGWPHCLLYPQWYQISLGIKETNKAAVLVLGIWSGCKKIGCCRGSGAVNPKLRNNRVGALTGALWVKGGQNPPQIPEQMSCLGKAVWYRAWRGQTSGGRTWEVRTLCFLSVWATMDLIHGPLVTRTKR